MPGLDVLGLVPGEQVRWRAPGRSRWRYGGVTRREADGSLGVTDVDRAARSIPVERVEVRRRGRSGWEPLAARATRSEQLRLL